MKAILKIRLADESENALCRLSEHILRAQRFAWCTDGLFGSESEKTRDFDKYDDYRDLIEIETRGRHMAYNRMLGYDDGAKTNENKSTVIGDVYDSTVMVTDLSTGSLFLEIAIPMFGFAAMYIASLYANDRSEQRQLDAQKRTIAAVQEQLSSDRLNQKSREKLLRRMIDGIGAFDDKIVSGVTIEIAGTSINIGSQRVRSAPALGPNTAAITERRKMQRQRALEDPSQGL